MTDTLHNVCVWTRLWVTHYGEDFTDYNLCFRVPWKLVVAQRARNFHSIYGTQRFVYVWLTVWIHIIAVVTRQSIDESVFFA